MLAGFKSRRVNFLSSASQIWETTESVGTVRDASERSFDTDTTPPIVSGLDWETTWASVPWT
jgi:hypothetical protein